jgi:phospholipid/cholesterol/gamma-HCH transport system substrate-binding protein
MKVSKEVKVGLFSFFGILILIFGYNFLRGINLVQGYNRYFVVYDNVNGVVPSTQIVINGLKVGQVEKIDMLHSGDASHLLVTLLMENRIKIPRNSTATITSTDLLGTKALEIKLASNNQYISDGDTLVAGVEQSLSSTISSMVSPIKEKSEQVLVTLDRVLKSMNEVFDSNGTQKLAMGITDFSKTLRSIKNMSERFDKLSAEEYDKLKSMMNNVESILHNIKNNNESISRAMKNLARISDSVSAANLTATINHTQKVMQELSATLAKINQGQGSLGKLANDSSLFINLNQTSMELTALLKDMQDYPGRYFTVSVFGGTKRAEKQDKKRLEDKQRKASVK